MQTERSSNQYIHPDSVRKQQSDILGSISVPEDVLNHAQWVIFISNVRSASTAFFLLMASTGIFDVMLFQPFKSIARKAIDKINIPTGTRTIFFKSTIGPKSDDFIDVISLLTNLGVNPRNINIIFGIREPVANYLSILSMANKTKLNFTANDYLDLWRYLHKLIQQYGFYNMQAFPRPLLLSYEAFKKYDISALMSIYLPQIFSLGESIKIPNQFPSIEDLLKMSIIWGEANPQIYPAYFQQIVVPTLEGGSYFHRSTSSEAQLTSKGVRTSITLDSEKHLVKSGIGNVYDELHLTSLRQINMLLTSKTK